MLPHLFEIHAIGYFFFNQKTAYEMRISDWSSDVCSSDLLCILDQGIQAELALFPEQTLAGQTHLFAAPRIVNKRLERFAQCDRILRRHQQPGKIGRASCRGRVCRYVSISVVAVSLKKTDHTQTRWINIHQQNYKSQ